MASLFGMFELNVHAPFYDKLNEVMGLKTDEFYESYTKDKTLSDRMAWVERQFKVDDPLLITAMGSITEGAILYSNFAFLKHFQAEGKNKLKNMTAGINFSVRDENLHSEAGAWLYKQLLKEEQPDPDRMGKILSKIKRTCRQIYEHESRIIDMIFEKGTIKGITDVQMKNFIQSRLNLCLEQLDIHPMFSVEYDPISQWFYKNINSGSLHDFFAKQGNNYSRDWTEGKFSW
jgi:ribonucleotide reductase beta subunit family protein with ferritin-like domain